MQNPIIEVPADGDAVESQTKIETMNDAIMPVQKTSSGFTCLLQAN
jgi:hypothetical protein